MLTPQSSNAPAAANRKARRANRRKGKATTSQARIQIPATARQPELLKRAVDHQKAGRLRQAEGCYRQHLQAEPESAPAFFGLGLLYASAENWDRAYECLKQAVTLAPEMPTYWSAFAHCLRQMQQDQAALIAYERQAMLAPGDKGALIKLAWALFESDRFEEALAVFKRIILIDPVCVSAHYGKSQIYVVKGEFALARQSFLQVLECDPSYADAYYGLIEMAKDEGEIDALAAKIQTVIPKGTLSIRDQATLHFALGRARRAQKRYDEAFGNFADANAILKRNFPFDREQFRAIVDALIDGFQPDVFDKLKQAASDSDVPVFIIGMPRSGSTLVERILASHGAVGAAGEFRKLGMIVSLLSRPSDPAEGGLNYPRDIGRFEPEHLTALGADYLQALRHSASDTAHRITDKLLTNFFQVGLIAILFPKAAIIHCRRDPIDTCLSCYFQNFSEARDLAYTHDLEHLGFYYRQYERVMAHWHSVLPGRIFEVDYEEMVADQEAMSRKLIDHIGLDWDEACLDFHKSEGGTRTASVSQVRKPIYNSSVAAWRHYESHLGPLKRALGL